MSGNDKIYLIDGTALIYRAFYAFIANPLRDSSGNNTSAIFGVANSFLKLLSHHKPQKMIISFDLDKPTFRHQISDTYKAHRPPAPEELIGQIDPVKEFFRLAGVPEVSYEGYEADDVIGTLSERLKKDFQIIIVTSDKDFGQIVDDNVLLYDPFKDRELDKEGISRKYGVTPAQFIDYLAIIGDTADNIPGIRGIGPKKAKDLLQEYSSLDEVYDNLDKISSPSLNKKLVEGKEAAYSSRELVCIDKNVPVENKIDIYKFSKEVRFNPDHFRNLIPFLKKYDLYSIYRRIQDIVTQYSSSPEQDNDGDDQKEKPNAEHKESRPGKQDESADKYAESQPDGRHSPSSTEVTQPSFDFYNNSYQITPVVIDNKEKTETFLEEIANVQTLALELQDISADTFRPHILGVSLYTDREKAYFLPVSESGSEDIRTKTALSDKDLSTLFAGLKVVVTHDIKRCFHLLYDSVYKYHKDAISGEESAGFPLLLVNHLLFPAFHSHEKKAVSIFDTMIASYLLDANITNHGLERIALREFNQPLKSPKDINKIKKALANSGADSSLLQELQEDTSIRTYLVYRLFEKQQKQLAERSLQNLFSEIEMPLAVVLTKMEQQGVYIDKAILSQINELIGKEIDNLTQRIYGLAGKDFNINSPKQLSKILFEDMQINPVKKTKTGFSTDNAVLEKLAASHEIAAQVITYRQYVKLRSTYVEALPELIDPHTGRIHSTFNQTVTSTGRLSSSNPNLQNIPIRRKAGKHIRKAFRSKDKLILAADYSQIELRLLGIMSKDRNLITAFNNKQDIHSQTAGLIFAKPMTTVNQDERRMAKAINFGLIYGMGPAKLARETNISQQEAKRFIDEYFKKFPKVKEFIKSQVTAAKKKGYAETLLGRKLYMPNIHSNNPKLLSEAERIAVNMPLQGTAADIIKIAMINIDKRLDQLNAETRQAVTSEDSSENDIFAAKMIIQVHDELVFEVSENHLKKVRELVETEMKKALPEKFRNIITLGVEIGAGKDWFDAHD